MPTPCSLYIHEKPGGRLCDIRQRFSYVYQLEHILEEGQKEPALTVLCEIDTATPGLAEAYDDGRALAEVCVDFYRIDPKSQAEVKYYRIALHKARVMRVHTYVPVTFLPKNENYRHMVEYRFSYESIEFNWMPDGIISIVDSETSRPNDGA